MVAGVDYTASTASILNLFVLSLDRYWSVSSPLKYLRKRTRRRALVLIGNAWLVSSLWLIPITTWHYLVSGGVRSVPSDVCDTEYATNTALKFITAVLNFFLPLTVMYVLYSKIYLEIKRRAQLEIGQKNHTLKRRFSKHVLSAKRSGCDVRGDASPREESLEDSDDSQENRADAVNTLVTSALLCAANIEHSFDSDLPLDADKSHDVLVTRTVKTRDAVSAGRVNTLLPPAPATNHATAVVTSAPLARVETRDDACEFPETSSTSEHQTRKGETQPEGATLAVDTRTSRAARSDTRTLTQHSLTLQLNTKLKQNASSCSPEHSTGTSPTRLS